MFHTVSTLLERLAERCLAIAAGLLASSIESACLRREAEQQNQLEELARTYEADGLPDIAANLRQRAHQLSHHNPAALGESLLSLGHQPESAGQVDRSTEALATPSLSLTGPGRRPAARGKRNTANSTLAPLADFLPASPSAEPQSETGATGSEIMQ